MTMQNRIAVTTNTYHGKSLDEALEGIAAAGFRYVEFAAISGWSEHLPFDADARTQRARRCTTVWWTGTRT